MKYDVIAIASSGGHLREMLLALEIINKGEILFVTNQPLLPDNQNIQTRLITDPHKSVVKYLKNFIESVILFVKYKPSIIITTGAGISLSLFIIGKIFGKKTIYIESGARIQYPSRTGTLLYFFSDHFIIQSEKLKEYYPKSILANIL